MADHKPTKDHQLPQGRKNWDDPPQRVDGPEGPEPHPTPDEAGAGDSGTKAKKPQQVQAKGAAAQAPQPDWPPRNHSLGTDDKPQKVDGPEGPTPTDGTELIAAATGQKPAGKGGKSASTAGDSGKADSTQTEKDAARSEAESKQASDNPKVAPK